MQTRKGRKPAPKRVAAFSYTSDPDSDPGSDSSSSAMGTPEAAGVHGIESATEFGPRVRTQPRIFFILGYSEKKPCKTSSTAPGECDDEAAETGP